MPTYDFVCQNKHRHEHTIPIGEPMQVTCPECGCEMRKVFVMPGINWGGLKPSQGELSPEIKQHINGVSESRDRYLEKKEQRHG